MHRLVRTVGIFLGAVIVCLAFLRAIQLENLLPLDSDDVGYINFQHSPLSTTQIDEGFAQAGQDLGLEVFQLSGTTGTREVTLISRAANQPSQAQNVTFFRPYKTGTVYPAHEKPSQSRSGIYAIKGKAADIHDFKTWLNEVGAIHTWESFTPFQTYFLPLAYQGTILILAVTSFLVIATIFGWFTTRAPSRIIRRCEGQTKTQIVYEDSLSLISLVLIPAGATLCASFFLFLLFIGPIACELIIPILILFGCTFIALALAVTIISYLTFPRLRDWTQRRSLVSGFSWVGTTLCALSLLFTLAAFPVLCRTYLVAQENQEAARQASYLPSLHSMSFGGIVDEARDYEPHIVPFADLVSQLEKTEDVFLFRHLSPSYESREEITEKGYKSVVILTPNSLESLKKIPQGCSFHEITDTDKKQQTALLVMNAVSLIEPQLISELHFFNCHNDAPTISVQSQGIFFLADQPLVVEVPSIARAFSPEQITSMTTLGAIVFRDPLEVIQKASAIGFNLTSDSTADSIAVYAQDQQLGYYVSLSSLILLLLASGLSLFVSAQIQATSRLRSLFPLYLNGTRIGHLLRFRIAFDILVIGCGVGIAVLLSSPLILNVSPLFSLAFGTLLLVAAIIIRYRVTRSTLVRTCQRKS